METGTTILLLLLAVVTSGFVARVLRVGVPLPVLQIALGAGLTWCFGVLVPLDPEFFLFFFIPPLLFADARRFPKREIFRLWRSITTLALGLVLFTVAGAGMFLHWLIPEMPWAVAFALAAVLSPTDPVAVAGITKQTPVPRTLMHVLEGEALLNDATGLVCLRFAVAAALTGYFSLTEATVSFFLVALGGLAIGALVAWGIGSVQRFLEKRAGEEPTIQIMVSVLMPFAAYLAAEHVHVSGILAAVAAGVVLPYVELRGTGLAETRLSGNAVWEMIQFALNGAIFVLLGEQIPGIVANHRVVMAEAGVQSVWQLLLYVLVTALVLTLLRFAWVAVSIHVAGLNARRRGEPTQRPRFRMIASASVAGVRGAITLAGVLTLPLLLPDGTPFPARHTAIFLACGVILVSLLLASVALPLLLKDLDVTASEHEQQDMQLQARLAEVAIQRVEDAQHELAHGSVEADVYLEAGGRVVDMYRSRLHTGELEADAFLRARKAKSVERQLQLVGIKAEREELLRLRRARELSDETANRLMRELDLLETQLAPSEAH